MSPEVMSQFSPGSLIGLVQKCTLESSELRTTELGHVPHLDPGFEWFSSRWAFSTAGQTMVTRIM